jgi:hypothetical protein
MRNASVIGQIGEVAVMQRLLSAGWRVAIPYGNSAPYDLIAEQSGRFVRLQVRTTRSQGSFISVNCRAKNNRIRPVAGQFDFLVVYELGSATAFVIPEIEAIQRAVFHIRLSPTLNGQRQGIHSADEYRERWDKLTIGV